MPSWMSEKRIGSASREKTPTIATCTAHSTAQRRIHGSPALIMKPGFTPSSTRPVPASATPIHTGQRTRWRESSPMNGTKTTYRLVMNAPFEAVVEPSPCCCVHAAHSMAMPASTPPRKVARREVGRSTWVGHGANARSGSRSNVPSENRRPVKAKAARWSLPSRCATKPVPQMMAAARSSRSARNVVSFIGSRSTLPCRSGDDRLRVHARATPRHAQEILSGILEHEDLDRM